MPNIALLDEILDYIEIHPEEWDQSIFFNKTDCGTAFCIAGHAVRLRMPPGWDFNWTGRLLSGVLVDLHDPKAACVSVSSIAQRELGLSSYEADVMFDGGNTLAEIRTMRDALANDLSFATEIEIIYSGGNSCTLHEDSEYNPDCKLYRP